MSDSFTGQQINASVIRLTAAQWTAQPYVLPAGVIGIESDTGAFKLGDGETAWADLLAYSAPTAFTQGSVVFAGAGVLAQNNAAFKWTDNTQLLVKTTSEDDIDGSLRVEFAGWNGSTYTTGLTLRCTHASSFFGKHIRLENGAYGTYGTIHTNGSNGMDFGGASPGKWRFNTEQSGSLSSLEVVSNSSASTQAIVRSITGYAGQIGVEIKLAASPTANADQILSSADVVLAGRNAAGEIFQTLRTPASAAAAGVAGTVVWDANYIYVCTATNTWKRVAIATW